MTGLAGNEIPRSVRGLALRALLLEWLGTLVCVLLAFAWLQIADSHLWQFAFSMLSGALLVFASCWVQVRVFQDLRQSPVLSPLWTRLLVFLLLVGLWLMLLSWIGIARDHAPLYAGYWNSKLSHELRYLATYERLVSWQLFLWNLAQWLFAALLLPIAVEGSTFGLGRGAWTRIGRVYRRPFYWLAALVCGFVGNAFAGAMVSWIPGKGLAGETISLILRLGIAYSAVILIWCFMVSLISSYLVRAGNVANAETNP